MFKLSEQNIQQFFSKTIYQRGRDYYQRGLVSNLTKNGQTVQALVQSSKYPPHKVTIKLQHAHVVKMHCNCLHDDFCKHGIAVLLALLDDEKIYQCDPIETLLNTLDATQLKQLLVKLTEHSVEVARKIELFALQLQQPICTINEDKITFSKVDFDLVRRQAHHDEEVIVLLRDIELLIQAEQYETALEILKIVTETQVIHWLEQSKLNTRKRGYYQEYDPNDNSIPYNLIELWEELVITSPLKHKQKIELETLLEGWNDELEDVAPVDFFLVLGALHYGWDYEPLQKALHGERDTPVFADTDAPSGLITVYLNNLLKYKNNTGYLNLLKAEQQYLECADFILRQQKDAEAALQFALTHFKILADFNKFCSSLKSCNELPRAMKLAEYSYLKFVDQIPDHKTYELLSLAIWLRDHLPKKHPLKQKTAEKVCYLSPKLEHYRILQQYADTACCKQFIAWLVQKKVCSSDILRMLVTVGEIQAVIALVKYSTQLHDLPDVVEAAITVAPEWVITVATENALHIIELGDGQRYKHAARWLMQAKQAYAVLGKTADWTRYYVDLGKKHSRKRKLMAEFKAIGL